MTPWSFLDSHRGTIFSGRWPTIPQLFEITAFRVPDNRCFTTFDPEEQRLTYREAHERVLSVAAHLKKSGVRPGDRVAVTGKNSPEWAVAYLAALYAEAVVVPIDYQLKDEEIAGLIQVSGSRFLFVDEERYDRFAGREGRKLAGTLALSPKKPGYIFDLPTDRDAESDDRHARRGETSGAPPADASELAAILYTSGTTGRAKGVMLTHENLVSDCLLAQSLITILSDDVFYALLPIHHSYTMLAVFIESISSGSEIVFAKRMAVKQILSDLKAGKVTMLLGIPMLFNKLLRGIIHGIREKGPIVYGLIRALLTLSGVAKKLLGFNPGRYLFGSVLKQASLDHIRICICGGGPLPAETFRTFNELGINFVQGYGLTETSPIVTLNPVRHYKENSVGKVLPEVEVKIDEPDEEGIGEVLVRGSIVMKGYFENPEATAQSFTEGGYLKTGDVGYLDRERYLYLTGRKKNMIVTAGGKNVFPEEIEDMFQLYDEVEQVMVRGYLQDAKMKVEGIEALVFPNRESIEQVAEEENRTVDDEFVRRRVADIIAQVNGRLLPYKRIDKFEVLGEAMEMTTTLKIRRFKVADSK